MLEFKEETCLQHRKFDYVWRLSGENIREVFSIWPSTVFFQQLLQLTDANQGCFSFKWEKKVLQLVSFLKLGKVNRKVFCVRSNYLQHT